MLKKECIKRFKGVFSLNQLNTNTKLNTDNIYFSIPTIPGQLLANDFSKFNSIKLNKEILPDKPIMVDDVDIYSNRNEIEKIRDEILLMAKEDNISIPKNLDLEVSHHYGIENFYKYGTSMITFVNEDYCKKLIFQFENQEKPEHFHKEKEETFIILSGTLDVAVDGVKHILNKGEMLTIKPEEVHTTTKTFEF